jgi:DNA-binding GntR family transcriptional regulator
MAIEPLAARRAASRISADAMAALQADLDRLDQVRDVGAFRSIDSRFHLTLAEWADCPPLLEAVESSRIAMFDTLDLLDFELVVPSTHHGHEAVLTAIAAADAEGAAAAMRDHIATATEEIDQFYGSLG